MGMQCLKHQPLHTKTTRKTEIWVQRSPLNWGLNQRRTSMRADLQYTRKDADENQQDAESKIKQHQDSRPGPDQSTYTVVLMQLFFKDFNGCH